MRTRAGHPQFLRRDFLVGSAAGLAVAGTGALATRRTDPHEVNPSYAQCGEEVIVSDLFKFLNISMPTYLDIGAYLPVFGNNTYLFYRRGSRGVLVEPNVDLVPELRSTRPGDVVLNVGVGVTEERSADYYCLSIPQMNTFCKEEAERLARNPEAGLRIRRVAKVPLIPINKLLNEHFPGGGPDFLSIDIESLDLAVLKSIDYQAHRPKVICTETVVPLGIAMEPETTRFLESRGYAVRGMTFPNTIFLDMTLLAQESVSDPGNGR
jgi:FkbM family methyltransferase